MASWEHLIDQETGAVDLVVARELARRRAVREWGGDNFPPRYLREATEWVNERAHAYWLGWRRDRGLPDDSPTTPWTSLAPDTNE
jgi:hypothetical protein